MRQLKAHFSPQSVEVKTAKPSATLSQSEIHLKALLGEEYRINELAHNVKTFVDKYFQNVDDKANLIRLGIELIENEKMTLDQGMYLYHACSNSIAFAYDVYTAMYQALQQDANWSAFRSDNQHFQRFLTINEFIAFYSQNGMTEISNNAKNYNDCALSANVFLFGNHQTSTSCSIQYLVNNDVRRQVDLMSLFTQLLAPFHVSDSEIKRLLALFAKYQHEQGGTLYQIAMPVEQARLMSYPSGCVGVMNALDGDQLLPSILKKLHDETNASNQVSAGTQHYISHLQARVMVPPHLNLATNIVKWIKPAEEVAAAYHTALSETVGALVHKILCHHNSSSDSLAKVPLVKVLPSILRANQLAYSTGISTDVLVKAIKTNDGVTVKAILDKHPELLHAKVSNERDYIDNFGRNYNQHQQTMTVAVMLVEQSLLPLEVFVDFTSEGWVQKLSDTFVGEFKHVLSMVARMPTQYRLEFLLHNSKHIVETSSRIIQVLEHLYIAERLEFANKIVADIRSFGFVAEVAKHLSSGHHRQFVIDNIGTNKDLCYLLENTSERKRLEVALQHRKFVTNVHGLSNVMLCLSENVRLAYACEFVSVLDDVSDVLSVLDNLYGHERLEFVRSAQHLLCSGHDLYKILQKIPQHQRLQFAKDHQEKISSGKELEFVLFCLNETDRHDFLMANQHKIRLADPINVLLTNINPDGRYAFAVAHADNIKHSTELSRVLERLDDEWRLQYVSQHLDLINDGTDLLRILKLLPATQRMEFACAHQHKIDVESADDISAIIKELPIEHRYAFASANEVKITNIRDAWCLTAMMQDTDSLKFILRHLEDITNTSSVCVALLMLPPNDRLAFVMACRHLYRSKEDYLRLSGYLTLNDLGTVISLNICNAEVLAYYITLFPAHARIAVAKSYQDLITTAHHLDNVLYVLPKDVRLDFTMSHLNVIKNISQLLLIMSYLTPTACLKLVLAHSHMLTAFYSLHNVLYELDYDDRLQIAQAHQALIVDGSQLSIVANCLPMDQHIEFIIANIKNLSTLVAALEYLPDSNRLEMAMTHQQWIKQDNELSEVLGCLQLQDRLAFARVMLPKVMINESFHEVVKQLPQDSLYPFIMDNLSLVPAGDQLIRLLELLPEAQRLLLLNSMPDKIKQSNVISITKTLPDAAQFPSFKSGESLCLTKSNSDDHESLSPEAIKRKSGLIWNGMFSDRQIDTCHHPDAAATSTRLGRLG